MGESNYYHHRLVYNDRLDYPDMVQHNHKGTRVAALFLYLNKFGYHGIYRVNYKNRMNTPYGHYKNPKMPTKTELIKASVLLQRATITQGDYVAVLADARKGDLVFIDPPYLDTFTGYTTRLFDHSDHSILADMAACAARNGAVVIATNRAHPKIKNLYPSKLWTHQVIHGTQRVAAQNAGKHPEIIFRSR